MGEAPPDTTFFIFTTNECHWCEKAKALLRQHGEEFTFLSLTGGSEAAATGRSILKAMGLTTVPQVFHGPDHVGGYTDLQQYLLKA